MNILKLVFTALETNKDNAPKELTEDLNCEKEIEKEFEKDEREELQ